MEQKLTQNGVAVFKGLQVLPSKIVKVTFKLRYDEIITSINLLKGLNSDITIHAKISGGKPKNLGIFTIGNVSFDKDGNALIQFKSMIDSVDLDSIGDIASMEENEILALRFLAVLELPEADGNES